MFEKYLEKLIKQKLGAFLEGVDENKLNFGMTEANLSLNNVKLKQDALIKLKMPINIELGEIKHLYIRVPWLKIGSSPVEVTVKGLNIIVSPQTKDMWAFQNIFVTDYLGQLFMELFNKVEAELLSTGDESQGYFSKLAMKVLDNISVSIKDIHFRFEDHFQTLEQSYSFGLVLQRLEIQTTNNQWIPQYVDRSERGSNQNLFKMVEIEGLGIYLNPDEKHIIYQQTQNKEMRIKLMEASIKEEKLDMLQYLLKPMSLQLKVEQNNDKNARKVHFIVELEKFHVNFLRSQLRCLIKFMELVSEFQALQSQQLKTKKFKFMRPIFKRVTNQNAKLWWQYAYQCIKKSNKSKNGSIREFVIPVQDIVSYHQWVNRFLTQSCIKKDGQYNLIVSPDDEVMFNHIMSSLDLLMMKKWIKGWYEGTLKRSSTAKKGSNFTSWLFRGNQKEKRESIMSDQEAEALDQEIFKTVQEYEPKNIMTVAFNVLFKEAIFDAGITNDQGIVEGIRLFASDIKAEFVQLKNSSSPHLTFDLQSSIRDFGVDLFLYDPVYGENKIQDSIIISNKKINKFGGDEQWKLRVRKRPEDNNAIEFDIELSINAFLLMYQKEFVKRAILISKVKINQEAQNAAIDKIEDIREATSNSIYTLLYKKTNRLRASIASPIIVLPLTADKNPKSPVWVLRLGDLKIESSQPQQQSTSFIEYENYRLILDSVRLKYYQTYEYWDKLVSRVYNLRELTQSKQEEKNDVVFSVIQDCSLLLDVGIKQKKGGGMLMMTAIQRSEYQRKPKVQIKGTSSNIQVNLSHSIYNKLVNLSNIFDRTSIIEIQGPQEQEQVETKQQLLSKAKKVGQVQKRLDPLNQWEIYFCILSESRIYFYKDASQNMPASSFYFKAASIVENPSDVALPNSILLKNRFGECCITLKNENEMKDWLNKIKFALFELQAAENEAILTRSLQVIEGIDEKDQQIKKKKKEINHQAITVDIEFKLPLFETLLVDELTSFSDWILFKLQSLTVKNQKTRSSGLFQLQVNLLSLIDLTMPVNSSLISQKHAKNTEQDSLIVSIHTLKKENPDYCSINKLYDIFLNNLYVKMQPFSINEVVKFFRNTRPDCSFNLMKKEESIDAMKVQGSNSIAESSNNNINSILNESVVSSRKQPQNQIMATCQTIKVIQDRYKVTMKNISLSFLHQDFNMEIYRLDSSLIEIDYSQYYDHMTFGVRFKEAIIYDLTCYPYTINPKHFAENPSKFQQTQREMTSMKPLNNLDFALDLKFESYQPFCALKKQGYSSKLNMVIRPMIVEFLNESFMRFFSYFFEQFMNALILTDPYNNPEVEELERLKRGKTLKRDTIKMLVDFQQQTEIIDMNIIINEFAINIPDRPHSRNYMSLTIKEFRVIQQIKLKKGRVILNKDKELWAKSFRMELDNAFIIYGGDTLLTEEPFNMSILYENLAFSPILAKLDPKIVDQSSYLRIKFDPLLMTIKQKVYTMILRILDLNINYTDFLEREYYFLKFVLKEEYFKSLEQVLGMRLKIDFKNLALRLEHVDNTFVSELMLLNYVVKIRKYRDLKSIMDVDIQHFFLLDQPQPIKFYKRNLIEILKLIQPEDCVIQPKSINAIIQQHQNEFFYQHSPIQNQVTINIKMLPNGEKDMKVDIKGLRISIKPHVLLMIQNFFLNSFPEYDPNSKEQPSTINFDPENASSLDIKVITRECLLVFQNRPGLKTLACHGDINYETGRQNIKEIKKLLEQKLFEAQIIDELAMDFDRPLISSRKNTAEEEKSEDEAGSFQAPQINRREMMLEQSKVSNDIAYKMIVKIENICPFVCSLSQLNEQKSFDKIKKRQLMNDFTFSYSYIGRIVKVPNLKDISEFGANLLSEIGLSKMKAKISIQDMILMNQIIDFANYNIINEYQKKLEIINQINKNLNGSKISIQEIMTQKTQIQNNHDIFEQPEKFLGHIDDEHILDSLNQQYQKNFTSEIQRLRSTTRALSLIAQKLTLVEKKGRVNTQSNNRKSSRQSRREKSVIDTKNQDYSLIPGDLNNARNNTHLSRIQDNPNQLGVFFNGGNKQGIMVGTTLDQNRQGRFLIEEEEVKRDTDVFYSAKDPRETCINEEQYLSPVENLEEDPIFEGIAKKSDKRIDEKKIEKPKFENALERIVTSRQFIKSDGIQIIFINDYDDVFCPVIEVDIPEAEMESTTQQGIHEMKAILPKMRVNYFNPHIGDQEPFIESFSVVYEYVESESALHSKQIFTNINFPTPILINMTDQCFENIIETYYSWMESPAYQYDDFKKVQKKPVNQPQIKSALGSLNENSGENKLMKGSGRQNSNTGSINEGDIEDLIYDYEQSIVERVIEPEERLLNADNFNKVSPYSIRNLTGYPIKILKKQNQTPILEEENVSLCDSFFAKLKNENVLNSMIASEDILEVQQNQIVQYTVDLDNDEYDILYNLNKKSNQNSAPFDKQRDRINSVRNPTAIDQTRRNKNQELITVSFEQFEDIGGIDLNKIDQGSVDLIPKGEQVIFTGSGQNSPKRNTGSSIVSEGEDTTLRSSAKSQGAKQIKRRKTKRRKEKQFVARWLEKLRYGVILKKMRKTLTIRQEYVLTNSTQYDYLIKINHQFDNNLVKTYVVKSEQQFALNSNLYKNHMISFKIEKPAPDTIQEEPELIQIDNQSILQQGFSTPISIEYLINLKVDHGLTMSHDLNLFTYIRKQLGEISQTFDIVLLPPISIKNCLPCELEIMQTIGQGLGFLALSEDNGTNENGNVYHFEKQDEKQIHIFNYLGTNQDEVFLRFRVSGFVWGINQFKRKIIAIDAEEDLDLKIKDKDLIANSIGVKLLQRKAGFQLIFYAHTVILNNSNAQIGYYQNTINKLNKKQLIGGQHQRHDMCIFSKEDSFLASISNRYSQGLQIKNIGLTEYFHIQTADNNISATQDEEQRNPTKSAIHDRTLLKTSQASIHEKRFEFVYQTYMSLVSDQESIYSKIVCIAPKYIIVNKLPRRLCVAQTGNELYFETLDSGERKEWFWADSNCDLKIVVKSEDEDLKWLWSSLIDVSELGTDSVTLIQDNKRFNNPNTSEILKITRKIIDGTTYIIFEEEDEVHPMFRIENLTDDVVLWYVQNDIPLQQDGLKLLPMSITAFAFQDLTIDKPSIQLYVTKSLSNSITDIDLQNDGLVMRFNNFNFEQTFTFQNSQAYGEDYQVKFSVCTDGYSQIVRISDKPTSDQEDRALQHIKLETLKSKDPELGIQANKNGLNKQEEKKDKGNVTNILKVNVSEILVSFVSKITERVKNDFMASGRKEIALLTIQDLSFERLQSTEQNIENNKLQVMKIQIDNQSSVTPLFPTVLQPMIYRNRDTQPMVDFELDLRLENPDLTYIENLDFKISGIVVKLDDRFLGYFVTFVLELQEKTKTNFTGLHPIFKKHANDARLSVTQNKNLIAEGNQILIISNKEIGLIQPVQSHFHEGIMSVHYVSKSKHQHALMADTNRMSNRSSVTSTNFSQDDSNSTDYDNEQYKSWKKKKIDSLNKRIFIKDCKLSSLKVEISFLVRKSVKKLGGKSQQSQLNNLLDSWGLAVFNIDQVPIKVRPFNQKQIFGIQDTIIGLMSDHFINNIKRNIIKLLFSFALFGNPRKLVATVSKGLYDFKTLPMQGQGVGGFMMGTMKGTVSLFKNTFEGAFGVAESFSGGLSKLALVINRDEDYLESREEKIITEKPRNLVEGVGFGCQTMMNSIVAASYGWLTLPIIEARRNGVKGFFKGVWSGTTGLFLKPMSGGLDLISKSAEGIKNTVKIFEAQIFNEPTRLPRVFYGNQELIKPYNEIDSHVQGRILHNIDGPIQFKKDHYIEAIPYKDNKRTMLLVLTEEHLILLDFAQKSLKWYIVSSHIRDIEKFKNGMIINLTKKQDSKDKVAIEITNTQVLQNVYDKIQHLQQLNDQV